MKRSTFYPLLFLLLLAAAAQAQYNCSSPGIVCMQNDASTPPVQNKLAKLSSAGLATLATTTDTNAVIIGVCLQNCVTGGTGVFGYYGAFPLIQDGATTAQHFVVASTSVNGDIADTGSTTYPTLPAYVVGQVWQANAGGAGSKAIIFVKLEQPTTNPMTTQGDVICGGASGAATRNALPFIAQTDGATITFALANTCFMNGSVTLGGNRTLNIANPQNGGTYVLKVTQDGTGSRTLTPGTGCTWKVANGGAGAFSLSSAANAIDVITWIYDGTNCLTTIQKNWN